MAARTYILNGQEVSIPWSPFKRSRIVTWRDEGGYDLETKGKYGTHDSRKKKPGAVIHWPAFSAGPATLVSVLLDGGKSTHFAVYGDTIYQLLDLNHTAYHAGGGNHLYGIDVVQGEDVSDLEEELARGRDVKVIKNETGRGDKLALSLDPTTNRTLSELLSDLSILDEFALEVPRNSDGSLAFDVRPRSEIKKGGVFGHFHLSENKEDPAPWWIAIAQRITSKRWQKLVAVGVGVGAVVMLRRFLNR